jgi:tRNA(His) 5'-end guanylyltransferase
MSVADKNELLFRRGVNFNDVPAWQKRGTGLSWQAYERQGTNSQASDPTTAIRRRISVDHELPMRDAFDAFVLARLHDG